MKRALALILGLIVAGGFFTGARATDFPLTVAGIQVDGNTKIRTQEIRKAVPFHSGDEITADDLKRASQAIFDLGWFSEVIPEVDEEGMILFRVVENPVVEKVEITGNVNKESIEILGLTLFRARIMPSDKIRRILRDHGVKEGEVLNNHSLKEGLEAVIDAYDKKGYTLIMVGKVVPSEILQIEIIEGRVTNNVITGLNTVPTDIAQEMRSSCGRVSEEGSDPTDPRAAQELGLLYECRDCSSTGNNPGRGPSAVDTHREETGRGADRDYRDRPRWGNPVSTKDRRCVA